MYVVVESLLYEILGLVAGQLCHPVRQKRQHSTKDRGDNVVLDGHFVIFKVSMVTFSVYGHF